MDDNKVMAAEVAKQLQAANTILITVHGNPDGDAIGSGLGLAYMLADMGKRPICYCGDPTPFNFTFLENETILFTSQLPDFKVDATCVLDASEFGRALPGHTNKDMLGTLINIDHHLSSKQFADYNWIDSTAAATAVLIAELSEYLQVPLSQDAAQALYVGIITDTGSFRYSNTDPRCLSWASKLVEAGVKARVVAEQVYESMPKQRFALLARCLNTMMFGDDGRWAGVKVTLQDMEELEITMDMLDGIINYPRSIQGVEIAVMFRQVKAQGWKISFRSRGSINVAQVAEGFGGGGHFNAAGGFLEGDFNDVYQKVVASIEQVLQQQE